MALKVTKKELSLFTTNFSLTYFIFFRFFNFVDDVYGQSL